MADNDSDYYRSGCSLDSMKEKIAEMDAGDEVDVGEDNDAKRLFKENRCQGLRSPKRNQKTDLNPIIFLFSLQKKGHNQAWLCLL